LRLSDTDKLTGYQIRATKSGYFAQQRNQTLTRNKLTKGVDGDWSVSFDVASDIAKAIQKLPFPPAVSPPPFKPALTAQEAIDRYSNAYWEFGVDVHGNRIRAKMSKNAHVALIATTGGGKSVLARTLIEQLRPYCGCLILDGKGSDYPKQLGQLPNVISLAKNPAEFVVSIRWVWEEMNERYIEADRRKAAGMASTAFAFPPLFVLIDELTSLRGQVTNADSKDGCKTFDAYVNDLLVKGREARIHLCLINQTLYATSFPGAWQSNLSQVIFLGRVGSRSLMSDTIPEEQRPEIAAMAQGIPDTAKGRGVFLMKEGGETEPVEFLAYYGWSEGTTAVEDAPTPEVRAAWESAARDSEDTVALYDRIGFKVDGPDWRKLPMEELVKVPTVVVTDENGLIPGMEKYDPLSNDFLGNAKAPIGDRARGRGSVATDTVR
jgi:S-DNA-T family DNA segregation ATPase FtsK/SpoIIIE